MALSLLTATAGPRCSRVAARRAQAVAPPRPARTVWAAAPARRPRRWAALDVLVVRAAEEEEKYEGEYEGEYEEEELEYEPDDDASMRLYLDSADVREWAKWADTSLFYGYTTNPSILKRDGVQCTLPAMRQLAREAFELDALELQLQAWGRSAGEMHACGCELFGLDERVVVKVPITLEGLRATRLLMADGVPVTLTGLYSPQQVVTALAAGASYAAPYLGRMTDAGKDGIAEVAQMQSIIDLSTDYEGEMRLLVASIRSPLELTVLAAEGCNTFTISPAVAKALVEDPLTAEAARVFEEHAAEQGAYS
eukprot:scaffold20.g7663.t1